MVVGSESGHIYIANLESGRSHTGTITSKIDAHFGMVTAMAFHPFRKTGRASQESQLLLTASVDWSTKLWCPLVSDKEVSTCVLSVVSDKEVGICYPLLAIAVPYNPPCTPPLHPRCCRSALIRMTM